MSIARSSPISAPELHGLPLGVPAAPSGVEVTFVATGDCTLRRPREAGWRLKTRRYRGILRRGGATGPGSRKSVFGSGNTPPIITLFFDKMGRLRLRPPQVQNGTYPSPGG
jgi:hypothetical protein